MYARIETILRINLNDGTTEKQEYSDYVSRFFPGGKRGVIAASPQMRVLRGSTHWDRTTS